MNVFSRLERFLDAWGVEPKARDPRLLRDAHQLAVSLAARNAFSGLDDPAAADLLREHLRPVLVFDSSLRRRFDELWSVHVTRVDPAPEIVTGREEAVIREEDPGRKNWLLHSLVILAGLGLLAVAGWGIWQHLQDTPAPVAEVEVEPKPEETKPAPPPPKPPGEQPKPEQPSIIEGPPPDAFAMRWDVQPGGSPFASPLAWWDLIRTALDRRDWAWIGGGLLALLITLATFWMRATIWREAQYLMRRLRRKDPKETSREFWLGLQRGETNVRSLVSGVVARFRQHESVVTKRLHGKRTVARSIQQGGYFTPVQAERPETPEYLFLLEERNEQDHLGRLVQAWAKALRAMGVEVAEYRFSGTPERPFPAPLPGEEPDPLDRVALRDLAVRFPGRRVVVFGQHLKPFRASTGEPADWFTILGQWETSRALLTPPAAFHQPVQAQWNAHGWRVFDFSESGITAMGNWLSGEGGAAVPPEDLLPPPDLLVSEDDWTGPVPLDELQLQRMEWDLGDWLGKEGLLLLRACAVFPVIDWHLTRYLLTGIQRFHRGYNGEEEPLDPGEESRLLMKLGQLPWLRSGRMPEWWREHLLAGLEKEEQQFVIGLVHMALEAGTRGDGDYRVDVTAQNPRKLRRMARAVWERLSDRYPELEDQLIVGSLEGLKRPRRTWFRLPKAMASTLRWVWPVALAVAGGYAGYRGIQGWEPPEGPLAAPLVSEDESAFPIEESGGERTWRWVPPGTFARETAPSSGQWETWGINQGFWMAREGDPIPGTPPWKVRTGWVLSEATRAEWTLASTAGDPPGFRGGRQKLGLEDLPEDYREDWPVLVREILSGEGAYPGERRELQVWEGVTLAFRWCPPGAFTMGSPPDEEGREPGSAKETQHEVTLTEGFWMAEVETTQRTWETIMGENPSNFSAIGPQGPVETVSWEDIEKFLEKVNAALPEGEAPFRLPTEAEWEYACRAGTKTAYSWGSQFQEGKANVENDEGTSGDKQVAFFQSRGLPTDSTMPVGTFEPNPWGLRDMHGNVWEWVQDWYQEDLGSEPVTDPKGPESGTYRVFRGGSWYGTAAGSRSANRGRYAPNLRLSFLGFRLARSSIILSSQPGGPDEASAVKERRLGTKRRQPVPSKERRREVSRTVEVAPGVPMTFCYIPPGTFTMGSPPDEEGREPSLAGKETQHPVTLTQGFWMAQTETTQAQWREIMGTSVAEQKAKGDDYGDVTGEGDDHPMYFVNWDEAVDYAGKLSEKLVAEGILEEGWSLQLPTEAQWEYACRAGTAGPYNVEGASLDSLGWYDGNSNGTTHPVGQKTANAWGLHDMHGNVWEWVQDWYEEDLGSEPVTDSRGPGSGTVRVGRGGSWLFTAAFSRSANRVRDAPGNRNNNLGFRLALVPPSSSSQPASSASAGSGDEGAPDQAERAGSDASPAPGASRVEVIADGVPVKFLYCPPGTFTMGSPPDEEGREPGSAKETQHEVTLTVGFWLAETETTQDQWQAVMGENPSSFQNAGGNAPVEGVSWEDITKDPDGFLARIQDRAPPGMKFALPTEAQWEYACRAKTDTAYSFGNDPSQLFGYGNFADVNSTRSWADKEQDDGVGDITAPVKSYQPNPWGFYDMHGNVWEWVQDWYEEDLGSEPVTDPEGPESGANRVLRGGSWSRSAAVSRSAIRDWNSPDSRNYYLGFRLSLVPSSSSSQPEKASRASD